MVTFDISKILRPVLGAWQISWAPTIEKSNARIAPSLLFIWVIVKGRKGLKNKWKIFRGGNPAQRWIKDKKVVLTHWHTNYTKAALKDHLDVRSWWEWSSGTCRWVRGRCWGGARWRCSSRSTTRTAGCPSWCSWCWWLGLFWPCKIKFNKWIKHKWHFCWKELWISKCRNSSNSKF